MLSVAILKEYGVDLCDGQALARCCLGDICADVPVDKKTAPGLYSLEEAERSPSLRTCLEVLKRQREKGLRRVEVCSEKKSDTCVKKLVEYLLARYGGPILLVGFNSRVARELFSLTNGVVADVEGRLVPYDLVDLSEPENWVEKARVVLITPGALHLTNVVELVKKAKELGKPIVMYGAISTLYKDLGIEYFCPYGLRT
ncbi:hypothetical protein Pogu_2508 [Pyrobaculum oguniense TE7]|uniref:Heavy-metal chelation domain-containing protein n=1 Tax=Pyrobaculum oguniense (strain DSM 13380 / JCM 10595 / TE7) TaxID=698757 RepID=H6QDR3_PYROT|nr:hypothetical protein Pogu_2508 [Pyrobaculum oguniense TE7]